MDKLEKLRALLPQLEAIVEAGNQPVACLAEAIVILIGVSASKESSPTRPVVQAK